MNEKTVALELVETLRDIGVTHIFGVPSGGWVEYMEAIRRTDGIDFVLTTHEGGAGFMADVCGRLTGLPGVCFGTFGPGATNLATGVGSALLDRSPMLAFTDEMPTQLRGRTVQMNIDHQALFQPITKFTTRLEPDKVSEQLVAAARMALSGRPGPVYIGLPVDMSTQIVCNTDTSVPVISAKPIDDGDPAVMARMLQLFEKSSRPVIAVGLGAVRSGVQRQILRLASTFNLPVVLTPMAKGIIPEDHPCYAGVLFHALSDLVSETHQQADLVIAVGYDPVEFNYESWLPKVPVISLDTQPADLDCDTYELACDLAAAIPPALELLLNSNAKPKEWDLTALARRRQALFDEMSPRITGLGPCEALEVLRRVLPDEGIMTCDVGAHTHLIGQKWRTPSPELLIMSNGWSSMGFGLPAAIAAKLCRPDLPVCCVVGDGGFLMTAGEIATAVRENLNIVILLLTDNDLALIRIKQEKKDHPIFGTPIRDKGDIGGDNIFGAPVLKAYNGGEVGKALEKAFSAEGPVIVEAHVDSREYDKLVLKKDKLEQ